MGKSGKSDDVKMKLKVKVNEKHGKQLHRVVWAVTHLFSGFKELFLCLPIGCVHIFTMRDHFCVDLSAKRISGRTQ